jgi:hypothetical protein
MKQITYEVTEKGCWNCTSHATNTHGYPLVTRNKKFQKMHRYIWEQKNGAIPEGMIIRHKCDNPSCINPDHLEIGTQYDNMQDMITRDRAYHPSGEEHYCAKLSEAQAINIIELYRAGEKQVNIARVFNVGRRLINQIVHGKKWKHIHRRVL